VVKEKDAASYERMAAELAHPKDSIWMIGNSPKSDINPALEAGLNAVFIPHARTWTLERLDLRAPGPGRLLVLRSFEDLQGVF